MSDVIVMVPCPRDGQPIWMDFDPGELQSWEHPGTGPSWLPLAEVADGVPYCAHLFPEDLANGLTTEEWTAIEEEASAIMQPLWDAEAKAEADGWAAYLDEEARLDERLDERGVPVVAAIRGDDPQRDDLEDLPF